MMIKLVKWDDFGRSNDVWSFYFQLNTILDYYNSGFFFSLKFRIQLLTVIVENGLTGFWFDHSENSANLAVLCRHEIDLKQLSLVEIFKYKWLIMN